MVPQIAGAQNARTGNCQPSQQITVLAALLQHLHCIESLCRRSFRESNSTLMPQPSLMQQPIPQKGWTWCVHLKHSCAPTIDHFVVGEDEQHHISSHGGSCGYDSCSQDTSALAPRNKFPHR
jgi:hypothetical protein